MDRDLLDFRRGTAGWRRVLRDGVLRELIAAIDGAGLRPFEAIRVLRLAREEMRVRGGTCRTQSHRDVGCRREIGRIADFLGHCAGSMEPYYGRRNRCG